MPAVLEQPASGNACSRPTDEVIRLQSGRDGVGVTVGMLCAVLGAAFSIIGVGALVSGFEGSPLVPAGFIAVGLGALAVGLHALIGRTTVVIDPGGRTVRRERSWLVLRRATTIAFDGFESAGIAAVHPVGDDGTSECLYYRLELRGVDAVALPSRATNLDDAVTDATMIAEAMGIEVDPVPRRTVQGFVRGASGRAP